MKLKKQLHKPSSKKGKFIYCVLLQYSVTLHIRQDWGWGWVEDKNNFDRTFFMGWRIIIFVIEFFSLSQNHLRYCVGTFSLLT